MSKQLPGFIARTFIALIAVLVISQPIPAQANGRDEQVRVLPSDVRVAGRTIGQWTGLWWRAALMASDSPFPTGGSQPGALGDVGGPVFFAVASPGPGSTTYSYSVPRDQYVLLPLYTYSWAVQTMQDPCGSYRCARALTNRFVAATKSLSVRIDGDPVPQLFRHDAVTPEFFTARVPVDGWWAAGDAEFSGLWYGVSSGYWLMLAPLSPGRHVLSIAVEAPYSSVCADGSDSCDVPEPGATEVSKTKLILDVTCRDRSRGEHDDCKAYRD